MYPFVTHTTNAVRGRCPHRCAYCYMTGHPSWTDPDGHDIPPALVRDQLKGCPVAMKPDAETGRPKDRFIFFGSSGDSFAEDIPAEWIRAFLDFCRTHDGTCGCRLNDARVKWLFQSKNPARFLAFTDEFPQDVMLATTIETNRDARRGPKGIISEAPPIECRVDAMGELSTRGFPLLVSIEPVMAFDLERLLRLIYLCHPTMVSIGADSRGEEERRRDPIYEPRRGEITRLVLALEKDLGLPVVQKKNLDRLLKPRVPQ